MEIGIKVMAEEIRSERIRHVNSCYFTMVAVDEHGRPAPVPPREPEDEDARRRQASAMLRRQLRREFDERFAQIRGRPA
jgi:acyl-CoA hydrolase